MLSKKTADRTRQLVNQYIVYHFDMDGVIARWNENVPLERVSAPGYFLTCDPQENIIQVMKYLQENGKQVRILGKVFNDRAAAEKRMWLKKHGVTGVPIQFITMDEDKGNYVDLAKFNVLVDDYTPNLMAFEAMGPGCMGIKFRNQVNGTKGRWQGPSISHEAKPHEIYEELVEAAESGLCDFHGRIFYPKSLIL